jgi:uncharacterized membrane protein
MMDGINHGWGMGRGGGMIISLIILGIIVWAIVKIVNKNNNPK